MRRLWLAFWTVIIISFLVLGWSGLRIYQERPPIPDQVVTPDGLVFLRSENILNGQNVWQAMGGMQIGSVWGHGSYVAPDWTADYLHRELVFILNEWSRNAHGKEYDALSEADQAPLRARLKTLIRTNTYDAARGRITIDPVRVRAFEDNAVYYADVFSNGREAFAIPRGALADPEKLRDLTAFFFWTSWAASTNRPEQDLTYTSNWPHEPLIENVPTADAVIWTGVSIILLLAGIGGMVWYHGAQAARPAAAHSIPDQDPLLLVEPTPSQKAVVKYFWVVTGLWIIQIIMGVITAHYAVEGDGFYGIPLSETIPYVITRTWHIQLGIFWIATAWLAAGLYLAPVLAGFEPKGQLLGVNILFGALVLVVAGSMVGQWMSINHRLGGDSWFYFGHQGYEYIELGRIWQIALFAGLALWVYLVGRAVLVALKRSPAEKPLLMLFLVASVAIGAFYAAGLVWGQRTNLAIVEYWRWWVVHLWVEGFFEVFATVVIAYFFSRLSLIRVETANHAVIFSSTIFLSGGIIGTLHHLYFSGTPTAILALGAVFSALEVVPLVIIGYEAWENIRLAREKEWIRKYRWPIYYFVSVSFWNLVGAGLFGFMINPPIALYYMQGLNTTPVHGHTALFGVYGMLGIGLMLFCLRVLWVKEEWKEGLLKFSFWSLNIGLMAMAVMSLLPVGLYQTWASVEHGYWYARSAELFEEPVMTVLKWLRVPGDTVFALGAVALTLFVIGLVAGFSLKRKS